MCPKSSVLFNGREDMHAVKEGKTECGATLSTTRCKKKLKKKKRAEISSCPKATKIPLLSSALPKNKAE